MHQTFFIHPWVSAKSPETSYTSLVSLIFSKFAPSDGVFVYTPFGSALNNCQALVNVHEKAIACYTTPSIISSAKKDIFPHPEKELHSEHGRSPGSTSSFRHLPSANLRASGISAFRQCYSRGDCSGFTPDSLLSSCTTKFWMTNPEIHADHVPIVSKKTLLNCILHYHINFINARSKYILKIYNSYMNTPVSYYEITVFCTHKILTWSFTIYQQVSTLVSWLVDI